jgi:integrase/recombinase XerD
LLDIISAADGPFSADALAPVAQVDGDQQLLELWLHGRSPHTQRAYRTDAGSFLAFVRKPLRTVTVGDV